MRDVNWDNITEEERQELLEIQSSLNYYYYRLRMRLEEEHNNER